MAQNKYFKEIQKYQTTYRGILIIHYIQQHLNAWGYIMNMTEHFELCKDDGTEKPWKRAENRLYTYYRNLDDAKKGIDRYLDGSIIFYTDAQNNKYVKGYNCKHGWGFNKQQLLNTMRMHKKGDAVMKRLMEDRLEDANFHNYCAALIDCDYDKFMDILKKEYG